MPFRLSIPLSILCLFLTRCQPKPSDNESIKHFNTIDYVEVGKKMEHVQTPYIIDVSNKSKRLVFIGCNHVRDSTNRQFASIEHYFKQFKPQIAFNEGGQIDDTVHYLSLNKAAAKAGELGCMKYLSDQTGIHLLNGDTPDSLEFALTLRRYPKQELYVYYVMKRIVIPYLNSASNQEPFEPEFDRSIDQVFIKNHFPLKPQERSLVYFKSLYQKLMGRPFELALTNDVEKFDYVNGGNCHFCAIGRVSKMVRDSILLTKLDQALDRYDRVIVAFGHGHALAVEPALTQLINKPRH